jgi:hypothetical protein
MCPHAIPHTAGPAVGCCAADVAVVAAQAATLAARPSGGAHVVEDVQVLSSTQRAAAVGSGLTTSDQQLSPALTTAVLGVQHACAAAEGRSRSARRAAAALAAVCSYGASGGIEIRWDGMLGGVGWGCDVFIIIHYDVCFIVMYILEWGGVGLCCMLGTTSLAALLPVLSGCCRRRVHEVR